jgi:transcriptional regulator with XRE-family HTH domain
MESENSRLKRARELKGLTLQQLAAKIGYSVGTISGIENGHDKPSKRLRVVLLSSLSLNEEWLASGRGKPFEVRALRPDDASTKAPPTASEVEGMFRQLSPSTQHSVMQTVFKQSLRECDVELTKNDLKRGWVDAALQYSHPDLAKQYPNKVRVTRLSALDASRILTEAIVQHDPYVVLIPALPASFVDLFPKGHPLRLLTPFCRFALIKVAVRLSFGDAIAEKVLKDMGLGFFTDLLSEKEEPTF